MFVETITMPADEFGEWSEKLGMLADPPAALVLTVAWDNGDGTVTGVNVYDNPEAVGDFWMERVRPIIEAGGEPTSKPKRFGEPVHVYVRPET